MFDFPYRTHFIFGNLERFNNKLSSCEADFGHEGGRGFDLIC